MKDAPVILLDEATASLDVENESAVQEALSRLLQDKTVLVIAHRMRTVAGADHIVVLENGQCVPAGNPGRTDETRRSLPAHGRTPKRISTVEAVNVSAVLAIKKNTARIIKTFLIRAFSEML